MKIGIWTNPDYDPRIGGGYSYYDRLMYGIEEHQFGAPVDIVYLCQGRAPQGLKRPFVELDYTPTPLSVKERMRLSLPYNRNTYRQLLQARAMCKRMAAYRTTIMQADIRLVYYPIPYSDVVPDVPFVISNWDIGHRSTWMFPEVSQDGCFDKREHYYNHILPQALMVLCESEAGRTELLRYTGLNPARVKTVHLFAGQAAAIHVPQQTQQHTLHTLGLQPLRYFYYPAQFWAHKNHSTLLQAFKQSAMQNAGYKLVLTGSDQGNETYIRSLCSNLGLDSNVVFGGFVDTATVATLYHNAAAMVMPTLMGPTNMPLLEAMHAGCPVVCTDCPGHREELAKSAIYIDPLDPAGIAAAMQEAATNHQYYSRLITTQAQQSPFTISHALTELDTALQQALHIRQCWQ